MAAANGIRRVWVGQNGLLSTPAVSAVIRERVGHDVSSLFLCGGIQLYNSFICNHNAAILSRYAVLSNKMRTQSIIRDPRLQEHLF